MTAPRGIISYGVYLPHWRLERAAIGAILGGPRGRGTRAVAGYDEDTTTLGVEAARDALTRTNGTLDTVLLATAEPAYSDKTNATTIAAALDLGTDLLAADFVGAPRSGVATVRQALRSTDTNLVVLAETRTGLPGSADERDGGDGAVALVIGDAGRGPLLAELVASSSVSQEFLDRWRVPGSGRSQVWEERFGEGQYVPLGLAAVERALTQADVSLDEVDHVAVTGLHTRATASVTRRLRLRPDQVVGDLTPVLGNLGTAAPGLALAQALDVAEPDQLVLVLNLADGADAILMRTTEALLRNRPPRSVAQLAAGGALLDYPRFLSWRGHLTQEPPRRPDPERSSAPPAGQRREWKFAFTGGRCTCGHAHLPPQRVCVACGAVDQMTPERFADSRATIATHTVDHLVFSPSPPTSVVVLDFDGGGRYTSEITDCDPATLAVGGRVEMTFRRLSTSGGIHNYFWKARPLAQEETR